MSRRIRSIFIALSLGLASPIVLTACKDKNLQATEVPAEGVTLRYSLAPGGSYAGHINQRETTQSGDLTMNRTLDFTVQLRVTGLDEKGVARVETVVQNLQLTWALPPNMPYSLGEFIEGAQKKIEGVTIRFAVTPEGKIEDVPAMPEGLDGQERMVLQGVIDGLTSAFFVVPDQALKQGETWTDEDTKGRQGKLGRYAETKTTSSFDGLFQKTDTSQRVAKLTIQSDKTETMTTKAGGHEIDYRAKQTALFDVDGNFLVSLNGTDTKFDSGETTTRKFKAEWTQNSAGAAGAVSSTETQQIDDPCDPDYVGPGECVPEGTEVQQIDDPCDPDYVGPGECKPEGEAPAKGEPAAADDAAKVEDSAKAEESAKAEK
jgi:hypothetical protein